MNHFRRDLSELEQSGLIRLACASPDLEYLFRHALIQDAAYASLVKSDRQALHLLAGEALERLSGDQAGEMAATLSHHFYEAGDHERALKYLTQAGDRAFAAFANSEAIAHYTRALAIVQAQAAKRGTLAEAALAQVEHLYLRAGRAWELTNRYGEAIALYRDLEALAQAAGNRPLELAALTAQATATSVLTPSFNPAEARRLIERAAGLAADLGDREAEAKIAWQRTLLAQYTGDAARALANGEQAVMLTRRAGMLEQLGYVLDDMVRIYENVGRIAEARAALAEAEQIWRRLGIPYMLSGNLGSAASLSFWLGDLKAASRLADEALVQAQAAGQVFGIALWHQVGLFDVERGDAQKGIDLLRAGVALAEAERIVIAKIIMPLYLALAYDSLGAFETGLDSARRAAAHAEAGIAAATLGWAKPVLARLCLANGRIAEAQELMDSPEVRGVASVFWYTAHFAWEANCLLQLALGKPEAARAQSEHALADLRPSGLRLNVLDMLVLHGRALTALGRAAEARAAYEEARDLAETIGSRRALWPILAALARLAAAEGRHVEAYELRRQARDVLEYIADHIAEAELRASLFNLPDAQEVMGA